jgi:hypothetical protein
MPGYILSSFPNETLNWKPRWKGGKIKIKFHRWEKTQALKAAECFLTH